MRMWVNICFGPAIAFAILILVGIHQVALDIVQDSESSFLSACQCLITSCPCSGVLNVPLFLTNLVAFCEFIYILFMGIPCHCNLLNPGHTSNPLEIYRTIWHVETKNPFVRQSKLKFESFVCQTNSGIVTWRLYKSVWRDLFNLLNVPVERLLIVVSCVSVLAVKDERFDERHADPILVDRTCTQC